MARISRSNRILASLAATWLIGTAGIAAREYTVGHDSSNYFRPYLNEYSEEPSDFIFLKYIELGDRSNPYAWQYSVKDVLERTKQNRFFYIALIPQIQYLRILWVGLVLPILAWVTVLYVKMILRWISRAENPS